MRHAEELGIRPAPIRKQYKLNSSIICTSDLLYDSTTTRSSNSSQSESTIDDEEYHQPVMPNTVLNEKIIKDTVDQFGLVVLK